MERVRAEKQHTERDRTRSYHVAEDHNEKTMVERQLVEVDMERVGKDWEQSAKVGMK